MDEEGSRRDFYRQEAIRRTKARGYEEGQLQWKWRTDPPKTYDTREVEDAILDALNREGVVAWSGDGVGCVEQIVRAQAERAQRAEDKLAVLRAALAGLMEP